MMYRPSVPRQTYTIRPDQNGFAVLALQLNLNAYGNTLALDGHYGLATGNVLRAFQKHRGLLPDGLAGPATQKTMVISLSRTAGEILPPNLLNGVAELESSFILDTTSQHPSDSGYDLGPYQLSIGGDSGVQDTDSNIIKGITIRAMATDTAIKIKKLYDKYIDAAYVKSLPYPNKSAWRLATLYHNWPVAANNIATTGNIYPDDPGRADEPAEWVITASGGRLRTPWQWVSSYMDSATKYVTVWA